MNLEQQLASLELRKSVLDREQLFFPTGKKPNLSFATSPSVSRWSSNRLFALDNNNPYPKKPY